MRPAKDMLTYRVLLRGEGSGREGEWIGFFTSQQVMASSEATAEAEAVAAVLARWSNEAKGALSDVHNVLPMVIKQIRFAWFRRPRGGFTFFDGDLDAEAAAQRIECRASGFSLSTRRRHGEYD